MQEYFIQKVLGEVFQGLLKLLKCALQKDRERNPAQVLLWADQLLPANHPNEEFAEESEEQEPLGAHPGLPPKSKKSCSRKFKSVYTDTKPDFNFCNSLGRENDLIKKSPCD